MIERFKFKPFFTTWIRCEVFVAYDCEKKPAMDGDTVITGIKQIGFIISDQYDVVSKVVRSKRNKCLREDCARAIMYDLEVVPLPETAG